MSKDNMPTPQHSPDYNRYGGSNWGISLGLVAAVLLGGGLYFAFSGDLIDDRSTAIPPPPAASVPVDAGSAASTRPSVPSTK